MNCYDIICNNWYNDQERIVYMFILILVLLLVFTCFSIEKVLKDIREQNKGIIALLKVHCQKKKE